LRNSIARCTAGEPVVSPSGQVLGGRVAELARRIEQRAQRRDRVVERDLDRTREQRAGPLGRQAVDKRRPAPVGVLHAEQPVAASVARGGELFCDCRVECPVGQDVAERGQHRAGVVVVDHRLVAGLERPPPDPGCARVAVVYLGLLDVGLARDEPVDRADDAGVGRRFAGGDQRAHVRRRAPHGAPERVQVKAVGVAHALGIEPAHRARDHRVVAWQARSAQGGQHQSSLDRVGVPAAVAVLEGGQQRQRARGKPALDGPGRGPIRAPVAAQAMGDQRERAAHHQDARVKAPLHEVDQRSDQARRHRRTGQRRRLDQPGQRQEHDRRIAARERTDHRSGPALAFDVGAGRGDRVGTVARRAHVKRRPSRGGRAEVSSGRGRVRAV
jgi:hypothetical protein